MIVRDTAIEAFEDDRTPSTEAEDLEKKVQSAA